MRAMGAAALKGRATMTAFAAGRAGLQPCRRVIGELRDEDSATASAIAFVAIATACGGTGTRNSDQRSGHDANEPTNSVTAQPQATRTALVGCLRGGGQAGSYTLVVTGDAPDRAGTGTSGSSTSGRPAPASSSTTGAGG